MAIEEMAMVNGICGIPSCLLPHQIRCWLLMECLKAKRDGSRDGKHKAADGFEEVEDAGDAEDELPGKADTTEAGSFTRLKREDVGEEDLLCLLVSSAVVRTTSSPELLCLFARHRDGKNKDRNNKMDLPLCEESFDDFLKFLRDVIGKGTRMSVFNR